MNERQRILELVKKGVITSEEGLVLLENLAKKNSEAEQTVNFKTNEHKSASETTQAPADDAAKTAAQQTEATTGSASSDQDTTDEMKRADQEQTEADDTADNENDQTNQFEAELNRLKAELGKCIEAQSETNRKIAAVQKQIDFDQEHITVIDAMEDLDSLTDEKREERGAAKRRVVELQQTIDNLELTLDELNKKIGDLNREIARVTRERIKTTIHFDDIRDQTAETFSNFGGKMADFGTQLGGYVRDTVKNVVDNIDWNDVTVKVPGIASTSFKHDFVYPACAATILDIKNANGDIVLRTWDSEDIKVAANIKFYGKIEGDQLAAFAERSRIDVNDDHFIFQVPNKRIRANLEIFLPVRTYDHINLRLLNGSVEVDDLKFKDAYLKTTNGRILLNGVNGTMAEVEDTNGTVELHDVDLRQALLSTVSGTVIATGQVQAGEFSTVHGSVKVTLTNEDLHRLNISSVNGSVKVALPRDLAFSGHAQTSFGNVNTRSYDLDIVDSRSTTGANVTFKRGENGAKIDLSSTSGSVFIKDND
ncbi:daptomycin-sensing surface protein LiaX [Lapidilactobacillus luobeiensis]|uniref:daptomycin-sensing surface protein LiaX n=1 Tax=Lapidilactobacillus luobeiensis TaxID=2950371 RepID=UPI0021C2F403|nr:daptomycin-sensing surface protein LiaX [Lapidilactobacillus luobeiensis]